MMVVPRQTDAAAWAERWDVIGRAAASAANVGEKRKAEDDAGEFGSGKRVKGSPSVVSHELLTHATCTAPPPNHVAQTILDALSDPLDVSSDPSNPEARPKGDVFLLATALDSMCTCESVRPVPISPSMRSLRDSARRR
jgi:hypothetical protein